MTTSKLQILVLGAGLIYYRCLYSWFWGWWRCSEM